MIPASAFFAQKHGALQNERALLNQVEALLAARDPREFVTGRQELTVDVPDVVDGTVVAWKWRPMTTGCCRPPAPWMWRRATLADAKSCAMTGTAATGAVRVSERRHGGWRGQLFR